MRITVGHVLILFVGVGVALSSHLPSGGAIKKYSQDAVDEFNAMISLFKTGEEVTGKPNPTPIEPPNNEVTTPLLPPAPIDEPPAIKEPAKVEPKDKPVPIKKQTVQKKKVKRSSAKKRSASKNIPAKAPQISAVPAIKKTAELDQLMGSYVSVELKTGRVVKGVLQEKKGGDYIIELPGMGPFNYPAANVKSIKAAE